MEILKKGLKFVPTPQNVDKLELTADFKTLVYKLKWKFSTESFRNRRPGSVGDNKEEDFIKLKTRNKQPPKPTDRRQLLLCDQIDKLEPAMKVKGKSS